MSAPVVDQQGPPPVGEQKEQGKPERVGPKPVDQTRRPGPARLHTMSWGVEVYI